MMIYSKTDLNNMLLQQQAEEALKENLIPKEAHAAIIKQFPCGLYTPNVIIRIALGLLTVVCIVFGSLLLGLMLFSVYIFLALMLAAGSYIALELLVRGKKYYNAGIDNVLQVSVLIFFCCIFIDSNSYYLDVIISVTLLLLSFYISLRFTDAFMAGIAYVSLIAACIFIIIHISSNGLLAIPFAVMFLSLIIMIATLQIKNKPRFKYYRSCLQAVFILSLISLYASGNVYVVTMFAGMYDMNLMKPGNEWVIGFFWFTTALIPIIYLGCGYKKKDLVFLRCGYLFLAAGIATFDYFYLPATIEAHMIAAGLALLIISFLCIRYFKMAKHGFTSLSNSTLNKSIGIAQTLISIQVAANNTAPRNTSSTQFGGGSTGGAGATGEW